MHYRDFHKPNISIFFKQILWNAKVIVAVHCNGDGGRCNARVMVAAVTVMMKPSVLTVYTRITVVFNG